MSKRNKQTQAQEQTTEVVTTEQPAEQTPAPEQPAEQPKRSLNVAREANASNPPVNPEQPTRSVLVRPAKGENPDRKRVFGYDNGAGGKVPVNAKVVVVNKESLKSSYPGLADALEITPEADVKTLKTAGVPGKSFRRAFRSGLIRFSQD